MSVPAIDKKMMSIHQLIISQEQIESIALFLSLKRFLEFGFNRLVKVATREILQPSVKTKFILC